MTNCEVSKHWHIDYASSDAETLCVDNGDVSIVMKRSSGGLIIDVYPLCVADNSLATIALMQDDINAAYDAAKSA